MAKDYYLVHHGILGQKWGIRRFQNKDGSYTSEGKRRRREDSTDNKKVSKGTLKKVAIGAAALGTVAAAAIYVKKHPEAAAKVIAKASSMSVKALSGMKDVVQKGKEFTKQAINTAVQETIRGVAAGIKEAPFKVAKAAAGGAAILVANKLVEEMIGKEQNEKYKQAYNAYNKKNKIGPLPKYFDDEDD